eukprot:10204220-Lingulodinium_polyedra.AAC.1
MSERLWTEDDNKFHSAHGGPTMISARGSILNNNDNALRNPICTVKSQLGSVAMSKLAALNPAVAKT